MAIDHRLDIYNTSGVKQAEITDFLNLAYRKSTLGSGNAIFDLHGDHDAIQYLTDKARVEIWRRNLDQDIDWTREFITLFRDEERFFKGKNKLFTATCEGIKSMLGWRIINWSTDTTNRSKFVSKKGEFIMKTLVDYNIGQNALASNSRKRDGRISNFVTQADGNNGNTLDWFCHGDNLLDTLQDLSLIGGGDFDVTLTGTNTYQFEWFTDRLGTDRSNTVLFSLGYGNMASPEYIRKRSQEKTIGCVWGRGEGTERDYISVTGSNYSSENDIEFYVDARNAEESGYYNIGQKKLSDKKSVDIFEFDVLQTPSSVYGKHYFLGDLVTGEWETISKTLKIVEIAVTVSVSDKRTNINIGLDNRI